MNSCAKPQVHKSHTRTDDELRMCYFGDLVHLSFLDFLLFSISRTIEACGKPVNGIVQQTFAFAPNTHEYAKLASYAWLLPDINLMH